MKSNLTKLVIALGVLALIVAIAAYGFLAGWRVSRVSAVELEALLQPGFEIIKPDGPGPFPTVVQFHGCGGLFDNQRVWSGAFRDAGWASVIVDSNGPRGFGWSDVCTGKVLHGSERAGDVLVALAHARALPFVDPERIVLGGWSHGGWSIMDLLAMDPPNELPYNLADMPPGGLSGVAGFLFVYPYCGFGTRSEVWKHKKPSLFLFAENDTLAPAPVCMRLIERLRAEGHVVLTETMEDAGHAFDERIHEAEGKLIYSERATEQAHASAVAFLSSLAEIK